MKTFKVVALVQIYNELEKGNLQRFFERIKNSVDEVVVYDDCSTDGSYEYAKKNTPWVIRGVKNDFASEIQHRKILLEAALKLEPDYLLSIDADEVVCRGEKSALQRLCNLCDAEKYDGLEFKLINLWRSSNWKRLDSLYDEGWFLKLWKVSPGISFDTSKKGLHQRLFPSQIQKTYRQNLLSIIHYGFADDLNLAYKYLTYKAHGQRGYEMLDRLVDEDQLVLEEVPEKLFPEGLYRCGPKPKQRSFASALTVVENLKNQVRRPKYSIACLIYKSTEWLDFVYTQILKHTDLTDVEFYFIANDADPHVIEYLRLHHIPHYVHTNSESQRKDWYINNVYRAYNYAMKVAKGDFVILINSDMCFSEGWLNALVAAYDGSNVVSSRLVESGKLKTGLHGIEKNFGIDIASYQEEAFLKFAKSIERNQVHEGGLYMPLFIRKDRFLKVGGYPEGNLKKNADIFSNDTALPGEEHISGDAVLMKKLGTIGVKHQTSFASIVYHFQCGEKDTKAPNLQNVSIKNIAVCNDLCTGVMGEKVLWNYLISGIPGSYPLDMTLLGKASFEDHARATIDRDYPDTKLIIQNATFIGRIHPSIFTICFLQDDLRKMGKSTVQQEMNLKYANILVTNSIQTSISYPEYEFEIIPVGVDSELFSPSDKKSLRKKHGFTSDKVGIFVGSLNEVKGWSKVKKCIEFYRDMTWIVVSKHDEIFSAANVKMYNRIGQELLAELLNCSDVFVIGSPVETQCLAAIEANLCDVPVAMPLVGIYKDFTEEELSKVGVFHHDLIDSVRRVLKGSFSPRSLIIKKELTVKDSLKKWLVLVEKASIQANQNRIKQNSLTVPKSKVYQAYVMSCYAFRNFMVDYVLGDNYWVLRSLFTKRGMKHAVRSLLVALGLFHTVKKSIVFARRLRK